MGGRESLAQAFTLLSFLSAGLLGLSSLPMWNLASEPAPEQPGTEAATESSDKVLAMGVWILSSLPIERLQSDSGLPEADNDSLESSSSSSPVRVDAALTESLAVTTARTESTPPQSSSLPISETNPGASSRTAFAPSTGDVSREAASRGSNFQQSSPPQEVSRASGDRPNISSNPSSTATSENAPASAAAIPTADREIVVDLSDREVSLYRNNQLQYLFPIAIGRVGWETPVGQFEIIEKQANPVWQNPITDEIVEPGPNNPLGVRWIGFWTDGKNQLGFHGTNQNELIGQAVSHGCIRMRNEDIERLYAEAAMGTPIRIQQ